MLNKYPNYTKELNYRFSFGKDDLGFIPDGKKVKCPTSDTRCYLLSNTEVGTKKSNKEVNEFQNVNRYTLGAKGYKNKFPLCVTHTNGIRNISHESKLIQPDEIKTRKSQGYPEKPDLKFQHIQYNFDEIFDNNIFPRGGLSTTSNNIKLVKNHNNGRYDCH